MSTSNRPVLFGVSTNEAGWQAAIHAVRPLHRLPCALRAACWPIGPRSVAARAATAAAHRAHQPPDGDGRRPPPARRWCTASAGTLASRPSTRTPARPRQASPAQASLRSCGLAQRQPAQWPPRRAGGRSSGLLEFLVDSPARPPPPGAFPAQSAEPAWTPGTIFLVTDHLYHLLVKNYMRRDGAAGSDDDHFGRAVFRLHDGEHG